MDPDKRLWEFRWLRDLALLGVVALILWAAYSIRHIVAPILLGAALAYVFNPLVTWAQARRIPRWVSATALMLVALLLVAVFATWMGHLLIKQAGDLLVRIPGYAENIGERMGIDLDWQHIREQAQRATQAQVEPAPAEPGVATQTAAPAAAAAAPPDFARFAEPLAGVAVTLYSWLLATLLWVIDFVSYAAVGGVIVAFCFFFFSWNWGAILAWFDQFIPVASRQRTLHVLGRMDRSVSAFIRGRLVQALVMGVILSVGWSITGIPYWLLLGVGAGLLNLVPFAGILGLAGALILTTVHHLGPGQDWSWGFILWPALVYAVAQAADGWLVEPLVQGKATNLDPLTVLLSVLIGGALAGLLGLVIAIPVAACIKILGEEVIVPHLRARAAASP